MEDGQMQVVDEEDRRCWLMQSTACTVMCKAFDLETDDCRLIQGLELLGKVLCQREPTKPRE